MDLSDLIEDFYKESSVDYVGLWEIVQVSREELGGKSSSQIRTLSMKIVEKLYDKGLRPGDYYLGSRFDFWPGEGCQAMLDRIEREWIKFGADPNLAEPICYFARPQQTES